MYNENSVCRPLFIFDSGDIASVFPALSVFLLNKAHFNLSKAVQVGIQRR